MATYNDPLVEHYIPCIKYAGGYRSNLDMSIGDGATVTLPSTTTIGGSSVVALGNITSSSTTATAFSVTNTGIFTGASVQALIADSLTTGTSSLSTTNGQTSGHNTVISSTGTIVTTGDLLAVTGNSATTSTGLVRISATGMTTGSTVLVTGGGANITSVGKVIEVAMGAATTGNGISVTSSGVYTSAGSGTGLVTVVGNSATTTTGLVQISGTGLTSGAGLLITGGGANMTSAGVLLNMNLGAAISGSGLDIVTTGVYTDTTGLLSVIANSATTGTLTVHSGTGITTGKVMSVVAAAATLTTGRYITCNDGALEVFGIGADGHIHTSQTTAPTIVVTSQVGITAAAITAGASDTCGTITTTGTSTGATILDITFNKTYTTAPKFVNISPANAAASMPNTAYFVSAISATGFTITVAAGGTYAATPSWRFVVIA